MVLARSAGIALLLLAGGCSLGSSSTCTTPLKDAGTSPAARSESRIEALEASPAETRSPGDKSAPADGIAAIASLEEEIIQGQQEACRRQASPAPTGR